MDNKLKPTTLIPKPTLTQDPNSDDWIQPLHSTTLGNNKYNYRTITATDILPNTVDARIYGHHRSAVIANERQWAFESREGMDLFIEGVAKGMFRTRKIRRVK